MKEEFAVLYDRLPVGKAQMVRQGLYYRISCRYRLSSGELCRLIAVWHGGWENIGIPVPEEDGFFLVKKIPAKKLPEMDVNFCLLPAGTYPDDMQKTEDPESNVSVAPEVPEAKDTGTITVTEEMMKAERRPISEDEPFCDLHRLENARSESTEGQTFAVLEARISQLQQEPDGAMIRAVDIGIDGNFEDVVSEPV